MDLQLNGKTALVSGSTGGIGLAIAERFAAEGAEVIVNGRGKGRVDAAIAEIHKKSPQAKLRGIAADLGTAEGARQVIKELPDVDILINNLGMYAPKPFDSITDEEWEEIFSVNVMSGIRLSRHYLPKMLKKDWGRVVFISSESAINIPVEMIHYGFSKTAQLAISSGLAGLTKGTKVTVNAVLPGPTRSEGVEQFIKDNASAQGKEPKDIEDEFFKSMRPSSLLQRFATTGEIANLVAYVASPLASATNGAALRVDGGAVRSII